MEAACAYLKAQDFIKGDKIAVIGFCIGGSYALIMACNENIKAAVSFYGLPVYNQLTENKPTSPIEFIPKLRAPLLAIFAGDDDFVSQSQVELLKDSLEAHKKNYELKLYPSQRHAFCDDTLPSHYDPAAAQDAWSSAIDFLNRFLLE
jgi:carboxymethylenebutenolidase